MEIRELLQKRADLHEKAKKFWDEHADKKGYMLESDALQFDQMMDEIEGMTRAIENYDKLDRWDKELAKPFNTPYFEPFNNNSADGYHKNFLNAIRKSFRDVHDELREGTLPSGGYLLPTEMHSEIISALEGENVLRQISKVITTESEHRISFVSQKPTATWVSEGEEIQFTDTQFGRVSLNAYKLAANLKVSNELLQDSYYNLEDFIITEFSKSFGRAEEESFLNGAPDVSGDQKQPTGLLTVLNQSATGTLQTTGSEISADDILTLIYSLDRPYRKSAVFLASDAVIMGLRKLKDSTQNFIWQPSLQEGEPPLLFGVPIYSSNFMPAPTSGNTALVFGDFKNYFLIGERGDRTFRPLHELYATSDQTGFMMIERIDCAVTDTRAFRGLKIRG